MRNYRLRNVKRKGIFFKRYASLAEILFPGVEPREYNDNDRITMYCTSLVESSSNTSIPYYFYLSLVGPSFEWGNNRGGNLGEGLLVGSGHDGWEVAPFFDRANVPCHQARRYVELTSAGR